MDDIGALVERKDIGVIRKVSGNRDGNILDLRDRATKAFIIVPWAAIAFSFALKSSTRMAIITILAIKTVVAIVTVLAIETVMAFVTALVIKTNMAIVTALVIETDMAIVTVLASKPTWHS